MDQKSKALDLLCEEFDRWEKLLGPLSAAQASAPGAFGEWSLRDVLGHLAAWQARSIARLDASAAERKPIFPEWPAGVNPSDEEPVDMINAWIAARYRDLPWETVYREWKEGYLRFIRLAVNIPEEDLLPAGRYDWMDGYALVDVLTGSLEHHQEHREQLSIPAA